MTVFVSWQLRVTLDSIRNSCDVFYFESINWCDQIVEELSLIQSRIIVAEKLMKIPLLYLNAPESLNFGGFDAHVLIIVKSVPSNF